MLCSSGNQSSDLPSSRVLCSMVRPAPHGVVVIGRGRHFGIFFLAVLQLRAVNCSLPVELDPDDCSARIASQLCSVCCQSLPGRTAGNVAK